MNTIKLKPRAGLDVHKPDGTFLNADGETVKRNAYWVRRINDGDVTELKTTSTTAKKEVTDE